MLKSILTRCVEIVGLGWYFSECREIPSIYSCHTCSLHQKLNWDPYYILRNYISELKLVVTTLRRTSRTESLFIFLIIWIEERPFLHSAKEIFVLMQILYMEQHAVEILHIRIDSFFLNLFIAHWETRKAVSNDIHSAHNSQLNLSDGNYPYSFIDLFFRLHDITDSMFIMDPSQALWHHQLLQPDEKA